MKWATRLILAAGFATLGFLLWHFSPSAVWADISQIGLLGLAVVISMQIIDQSLNALAWRYCFAPKDAKGLPFWVLIKGRMAGDGVNYLTPSGTVAGEFVRPGILGDLRSSEVKNSSVFVGKLSQALAQPVFILVGMLFLVLDRYNVLEGRELLVTIGGALLVVALVSLALFVLSAKSKTGDGGGRFLAHFGGERVVAMRRQMPAYLRHHPMRFVAATFFFTAGYGFGIVEVLVITRFMGLTLDPVQALAVETFSNVVDSMMFFVPAKVGTQEAGKVAIFHILGFSAGAGLAFGLIRHTREIVWASAGFLIYAVNQRKAAPRAEPA